MVRSKYTWLGVTITLKPGGCEDADDWYVEIERGYNFSDKSLASIRFSAKYGDGWLNYYWF
jgi:hypothetical protein